MSNGVQWVYIGFRSFHILNDAWICVSDLDVLYDNRVVVLHDDRLVVLDDDRMFEHFGSGDEVVFSRASSFLNKGTQKPQLHTKLMQHLNKVFQQIGLLQWDVEEHWVQEARHTEEMPSLSKSEHTLARVRQPWTAQEPGKRLSGCHLCTRTDFRENDKSTLTETN